MKYITFALLLMLFNLESSAQNLNFTLANPQPLIHEVYGGSLLSGDLDNDGDIDLVQSGLGENFNGTIARTSVFLNDGSGNFTILPQNFNSFWSVETVVMGDLDNDNDLDIIIAAINRIDFYRNDGQGQFTFQANTPFKPSSLGVGELIIGDVDGDGDQDVVQFGTEDNGPTFADLYLNDGSGAFSLVETDFATLPIVRIEFIDLEGDGDKDILSFGKNDNDEAQVNVYENDGSGNYSDFLNSNIVPQSADEISVGDIDNDGDEDILVTGRINNFTPITKLYLNNGNGQFSELMNSPFPDMFASSNSFADMDNDNDLDVLITGSMAGGLPNIFSIVFENLGNNNFVAADSLGGEYITVNTIADFTGDGLKDIIIQGFVDDTNIYWNETNDTPLPVELISFNGRKNEKGVTLEWLTSNEKNNDYFLIERSSDGVKFEALQQVAGLGNTHEVMEYAVVDNKPNHGINYYRLTQFDLNGTRNDVSKIIAIEFTEDAVLSVSPNPVSGDFINLNYATINEGPVHLEIFDVQGRLLKTQIIDVNREQTTINIELPELSTGLYVLRTLQNGDSKMLRFLKR